MHPLFVVGVAVGFAAGALLGYVVTKRVIERIAGWGRATIVRACAYGAGLIAVVPASFYAFILGGNFGGGGAAFLFGQWAVATGIGFGIAVALAICIFLASACGALLGVLVSRALGKEHAA